MPLITDPADLARLYLANAGSSAVPENMTDPRATMAKLAASPAFVSPSRLGDLIEKPTYGKIEPHRPMKYEEPAQMPARTGYQEEEAFKAPQGWQDKRDQAIKKAREALAVQPAPTPTTVPPVGPVGTPTTPEPHQFEGQYTVNPNAPKDQAAFVEQVTPHVLAAAKETGVEPKIILAQAILESGAGKSAPGFNYFGIKSHGRPGGQELATTEVVDGKSVPTKASFRTYGSPGESFKDYGDFLKTNSIYADMLKAKGIEAQLAALGKSGYASDPQYVAKLQRIIATLPELRERPPEADTRAKGGRVVREYLDLSRGYR